MAEAVAPTAANKPGFFKNLFNRKPKADKPAPEANAQEDLLKQLADTKDVNQIEDILNQQKDKEKQALHQDPTKQQEGATPQQKEAKIIPLFENTKVEVKQGAPQKEDKEVLSDKTTKLSFSGKAGKPVKLNNIRGVLNTILPANSSVSLVHFKGSHSIVQYIRHDGEMESIEIPESEAAKQILYPSDGSKPMSVAEIIGMKENGYYENATWREKFEKKLFSREELAKIGTFQSKFTEESAKNGEEAVAVIPRDRPVAWEIDCKDINFKDNCKSYLETQKGTSIGDSLNKNQAEAFSLLLSGSSEVELAEVSVCDEPLVVTKDGKDFDFEKGRIFNPADAEEIATGDKFQKIDADGNKTSTSIGDVLTKRHLLKVSYDVDVKQEDGSTQKQKVTSWVLIKNMTEDKFVMLAEQSGSKNLKIENLPKKNQHFMDTRNPLNLAKVWEHKDVPKVESPGVNVASIFDGGGSSGLIEQTGLGGEDGATEGNASSTSKVWYNPFSWFSGSKAA